MALKYVALEELLGIIDSKALAELSDDVDDATGPIKNEEVMGQALAHAESLAETYVQARYAVPLPTPYPLAFVRAVLVIARFYLFDRRQIREDSVTDAYNDAMRWLAMVKGDEIDLYPAVSLPDVSEVRHGTSYNTNFDSGFFV